MQSEKVPFPFGHCLICKDKATGIHYGVATCEGCKGFFKRSMQKEEKYRCFFGGECEITPQNRNRCKSCRFQLCLKNGMSFQAVKMGRIPKIEKERALKECNSKSYVNMPSKQLVKKQRFAVETEKPTPTVPTCNGHKSSSKDSILKYDDSHHLKCDSSHDFDTSYCSKNSEIEPGIQLLQDNNMKFQSWVDTNSQYESSYSNSSTECNIVNVNTVAKSERPVSLSCEYVKFSESESSDKNGELQLANLNGKKGRYTPSMIKVLIEKVIETSQENICRVGLKDSDVDMEDIKYNNDSSICNNGWANSESNSNNSTPESVYESSMSSAEKKDGVSSMSYSCFDLVQPSAIFGNIPLHVLTEDHVDKLKHTDIYVALKEDPIHMIKSIISVLKTSNDNKDPVLFLDPYFGHMTTDSRKLMQMTLQKLIPQVNAFLKPQWSKRNYVRNHLEKLICASFTTTEQEEMPGVWEQLMISVEHFNEIIIGFCTSTPGFNKLDKELQEYLLKKAYFDIWLLTSAEFLFNGQSHLVLPDRRFYSKETMSYILKENTVKNLFEVSERLNNFHFCDLEFCLLCIIQLTSTDMIDSQDFESMESLNLLHSHYLDIFMSVVFRNRKHSSSKILSDTFQLLPMLSKVSAMLQKQVPSYSISSVPSEEELQKIASQAKESV